MVYMFIANIITCNNIPEAGDATIKQCDVECTSAEAIIPMSRSLFIYHFELDEAKWRSMSDYLDCSEYLSHISCCI